MKVANAGHHLENDYSGPSQNVIAGGSFSIRKLNVFIYVV